MAGIKETPTNVRVYYKSMKDAYTLKREEALKNLVELRAKVDDLYNIVSTDFENNQKDYNINLNDYIEFKNNEYIDGKFLRTAKGIVINRDGNYELVGRNFDIYQLAKTQKDIVDIQKNIDFCNKLLNVTVNEYINLVKLFYSKVQEQMVINGYGYVFEGFMGWICINRAKNKFNGTRIDYQKTKERKAQLLAEGKKLYNKEEAEWCKQNGIEYKAEDGRVMQNMEYFYEIPLIGCKLPNGSDIKFQCADYRSHSLRGTTNKDILEQSGGDKYKICAYDVDMRTKLNICLQADKMLYTKFIRNENQTANVVRPIDR